MNKQEFLSALTERLEEIARRTAAYSGGVEAVPNSGLLCDE